MEIYHQQNVNLGDAARDNVTYQLERLLNEGKDPDERSEEGLTPLMNCALYGSYEVAQMLLNAGADPDIQHESEKTTALMMASAKGYVNIAELLVNHGAQINIRDIYANDARFYAVFSGSLEILELLWEESADPGRLNAHNKTMLDVALEEGYGDIVAFMFDKGAQIEAAAMNEKIKSAAAHGYNSILDVLESSSTAESKSQPNVVNPLHKALLHGRADTALWLLKHGYDPASTDSFGNNALHYAAYQCGDEIIRRLFEWDTSLIQSKNSDGQVPEDIAAEHGNEQFLTRVAEK